MATPKLYPYQQELYKEITKKLKVSDLICLAATQGAGKTEIVAQMIVDLIKKDKKIRILVLTHNQEVLRDNFADRFHKHKFLHGKFCVLDDSRLVESSKKANIVVSLPATVHRHIHKMGKFDYVVVDEAHQYFISARQLKDNESTMHDKIRKYLNGQSTPPKYLLLTASHYRIQLEEKDKIFFSRERAFEEGKICSASLEIVEVDKRVKDDVYTIDGEIKGGQKMLGLGSSIYQLIKNKSKRPAMIQVNSQDTAIALEKELRKLSKGKIKLAASTYNGDGRSEILDDFKKGVYEVAIVVRRGILGFDYPEMKVFIDASFSRNVINIEQAVGRVLRLHPDDKDIHKSFIKLASRGTVKENECLMGAVIGLSENNMYRTWDGQWDTIKVVTEKPLFGPTRESEGGGGGGGMPSNTPKKKLEHLETTFKAAIAVYRSSEDSDCRTLKEAMRHYKKLRLMLEDGGEEWQLWDTARIVDFCRQQVLKENMKRGA